MVVARAGGPEASACHVRSSEPHAVRAVGGSCAVVGSTGEANRRRVWSGYGSWCAVRNNMEAINNALEAVNNLLDAINSSC